MRKTSVGLIQRYFCRDCRHRFSESSVLSARSYNYGNRQVCAVVLEAKNLAKTEPLENGLAGATEQAKDVRGYIVTYATKQLTMGLKEKTVKDRVSVLELLNKRGADLLVPESVFDAINQAKRFDKSSRRLTSECWSEGTKSLAAEAYLKFCKINEIPIPCHVNFKKWSKRSQKLPWIPAQREIDQLIAGCSRRTATFLKLLQETGARSGEAWRLTWSDIDLERRMVTINAPEKYGRARQFKVSSKLISMLKMLRHKNSGSVWGNGRLNAFRQNFIRQRKRIAAKLQNPIIGRITFHTFRHFYGSMEYFKTKDILYVKERLGHRRIESTLVYTHLVNFEGDEYHVKTSASASEDEELLKAGFEYVTERDGIKMYRKRK